VIKSNRKDINNRANLLQAGQEILWDPYFMCPQAKLSKDLKRAKHSKRGDWESIQVQRGYSQGKHYFEVLVTGRITVGT
jgi:hypothetical protein